MTSRSVPAATPEGRREQLGRELAEWVEVRRPAPHRDARAREQSWSRSREVCQSRDAREEARQRALARLVGAHSDEFRALMAEELDGVAGANR